MNFMKGNSHEKKTKVHHTTNYLQKGINNLFEENLNSQINLYSRSTNLLSDDFSILASVDKQNTNPKMEGKSVRRVYSSNLHQIDVIPSLYNSQLINHNKLPTQIQSFVDQPRIIQEQARSFQSQNYPFKPYQGFNVYESTNEEFFNFIGCIYKADLIGQLTSFLCNSKTYEVHSNFDSEIKALSHSHANRILEMIITSEGIERVISDEWSNPLYKLLIGRCTSSGRIQLLNSLSESFFAISQCRNGCNSLIALIRVMKEEAELNAMQNLIIESVYLLSSHSISCLVIMEYLSLIKETARPNLNLALIKNISPLLLNNKGVEVVRIYYNKFGRLKFSIVNHL